MKARHFAIFAAWAMVVIVITSAALFVFTYGDCFDDAVCKRATNRNFFLIVGIAFVVFWSVTLALARKWNRDVW